MGGTRRGRTTQGNADLDTWPLVAGPLVRWFRVLRTGTRACAGVMGLEIARRQTQRANARQRTWSRARLAGALAVLPTCSDALHKAVENSSGFSRTRRSRKWTSMRSRVPAFFPARLAGVDWIGRADEHCKSFIFNMVRKRGFEPPLGCPN